MLGHVWTVTLNIQVSWLSTKMWSLIMNLAKYFKRIFASYCCIAIFIAILIYVYGYPVDNFYIFKPSYVLYKVVLKLSTHKRSSKLS